MLLQNRRQCPPIDRKNTRSDDSVETRRCRATASPRRPRHYLRRPGARTPPWQGQALDGTSRNLSREDATHTMTREHSPEDQIKGTCRNDVRPNWIGAAGRWPRIRRPRLQPTTPVFEESTPTGLVLRQPCPLYSLACAPGRHRSAQIPCFYEVSLKCPNFHLQKSGHSEVNLDAQRRKQP